MILKLLRLPFQNHRRNLKQQVLRYSKLNCLFFTISFLLVVFSHSLNDPGFLLWHKHEDSVEGRGVLPPDGRGTRRKDVAAALNAVIAGCGQGLSQGRKQEKKGN